jgi:hypothetical protein
MGTEWARKNKVDMEIALIAAVSLIVGAIVTGLYALRAKRNEYVNEYFKTVLARRVAAYEQLEKLVLGLRTCVVEEEDNRPYHYVFASDDGWESAFDLLGKAMSQGLWLSDEVWTRLRDLNILLFRMTKPANLKEFGRTIYQEIALLRSDLEGRLANDMLHLHDVERFLANKATKGGDNPFITVMLKK